MCALLVGSDSRPCGCSGSRTWPGRRWRVHVELDVMASPKTGPKQPRWARMSNKPTDNNEQSHHADQRVGFGFRCFAHYCIRVLLSAGKPNWGLLATITPR